MADGYTKYISESKKDFKLDGTDLFNARYPQVLASKSVLFCPIIESDHIDKITDGVHYVCVDENNFVEKIDYYLSNPHLLDKIVVNANKWVSKNCSGDVVSKRLLKDFTNVIQTNYLYNVDTKKQKKKESGDNNNKNNATTFENELQSIVDDNNKDNNNDINKNEDTKPVDKNEDGNDDDIDAGFAALMEEVDEVEKT